MMTHLLSFCLRHRASVLLLGLILTMLSGWVISRLPVDVFPELYVPRVTVQTEASGLTAEEVEQYISIPIESAMSGATGVKEVRSSSGSGLSFVWVDFDWDTDIYRARQIVSERLSSVRAKLPENVEVELAPIVSVTGEIMLIALTSDERTSPLDLRRMAEFQLRNRLMSISGVGQVTVLGGRMPEYQVLYNPEKMRQAGITLSDLKETVQQSQSTMAAGYLEDVAGQEIPLQQQSRAFSPEEMKRAIVPAHPSGVLRLEDVADLSIAGAPRRGNAGYMGQEAVILSVQKVPGANTMQLTEAVDQMVSEFAASQLPEGVSLNSNAYRQSDFISLSLENGKETLLIAAGVVMLVILLTLLNLRTALITLLSMPLSVMLGMACFPMFGLAINIMTLGGLAVAVGDVVDNTIIFVEVSWRALKRNAALPEAEQKSRYEVIMAAKGEIVGSMGFSSLIILLVFAPLLFLGGMEGQFYRPLGISYMLALVASLLVALTMVPVLCLLLFKQRKGDGAASVDSSSARFIKRVYAPVLAACLRFPKLVVALLFSLTAATLWLASSFGASFLPPFNEDCYTVFVNAVPGTSLDETERVSRQVMGEIQKIDGVKSVAQRTGRAENDEHAEPVSASELVVRVDLARDQKRIREEIREILHRMTGMSGMIGYPLAHRISSALSGSNSEIAINIYGSDLAQLREAAKKAEAILSEMPEVADARANREVMVETLRIVYNREVLAAYGLSIADAAEQVSTAFNGLKMGEVIKNLDRWDIVLRLDPAMRQSLDDVRQLQLVAAGGKIVRLQDVADVFREDVTNLVLRDRTMRKAMISCNPSAESNLGDLAAACREKLDPAMQAMGCSVDYAGTIKSREEAQTRLGLLGALVLVLIVLLLTGSLGSLSRALLTLINIPLCLVGGILAVFLASGDTIQSLMDGHYVAPILSVSSMVGFVTVIGFAIRSALIMLNRYRCLEEEGMSTEEAIREGSLERVIPIIMTSLTTILGLLPLIWAKDDPGGELLAPLAIVQFGGLLSATLLNLLVIPASCKIFARWMR
ncbi:MAG: efflux RND transporter permease subunit [Akkermansia sp.]